jgi:hypothetical protein
MIYKTAVTRCMFTVRKANFFSAMLAGQTARMPFGNNPSTCNIPGQLS